MPRPRTPSTSKWSRLESERSAARDLLTRDWSAPVRPSVLDGLESMEPKLTARGFPPISPWWLATFRRWYATPRRTAVLRVGRGGGKSSSISRLAVAEAIYGDHDDIPPGDMPTVPIVSVDRREASRRIMTIKAILDALEEPYKPIDGGVMLERKRRAFQVFTATIAGVSGFTSIFVFCDEVAKWRDADTGANPASEVLASIRPTFRGRPQARMALSSSPMGELDAHADAFRDGETEGQIVAHATSFEANPTMSEKQTRIDEPDESKWRREYLAIPLEGSEESLYSPALLRRCTRESGHIEPKAGWSYVAAADFATRGNAWTLVIATVDHEGRGIVTYVREWRGTQSQPLDPDKVFPEMAEVMTRYGVKVIRCDAYGTDFAASCARRAGLTLDQSTLTPVGKLEMFEELGKRMAAGQIELHPDAMLRADLLGIRRVLSRAGQSLQLAITPDGRHSDYAPSFGRALSTYCRPPRELVAPEDQIERESLEADLSRYAGRPTKERPLPGQPGDIKRAWWERRRRALRR